MVILLPPLHVCAACELLPRHRSVLIRRAEEEPATRTEGDAKQRMPQSSSPPIPRGLREERGTEQRRRRRARATGPSH